MNNSLKLQSISHYGGAAVVGGKSERWKTWGDLIYIHTMNHYKRKTVLCKSRLNMFRSVEHKFKILLICNYKTNFNSFEHVARVFNDFKQKYKLKTTIQIK